MQFLGSFHMLAAEGGPAIFSILLLFCLVPTEKEFFIADDYNSSISWISSVPWKLAQLLMYIHSP